MFIETGILKFYVRFDAGTEKAKPRVTLPLLIGDNQNMYMKIKLIYLKFINTKNPPSDI